MGYEQFKRMGESVGGALNDKARNFTLTRGNQTFLVKFNQNKNTRVLTIECKTAPLPRVCLRKESKIDRAGKRIGLNREVQTGDAVFDGNVYTESNADDAVLAKLLSVEQIRAATLLVLQTGFAQVNFSKTGIKIEVTGSSPEAVFDVARFQEAVGGVGLIADNLPQFADWEQRTPWWTMGIIVSFASVAAMIASFIFTAVAGASYRPLDWGPWLVGWTIGVVAWWVWLPVCGRLVRGRSNSMRHFLASMILMTVGLPVSGGAAVVYANGSWDTSPQVVHVTQVTNQWTTKSKNSTTYNTEVAGWRDSSGIVFTGFSFYNSKKIGSPVTVVSRAGAFGWEWIEQHY